MVKLRPDKNLYFNKGLTRKKQIYEWFTDVVFANNLGSKFRNVIQFGRLGQRKDALNEFTDIVKAIVEQRPTRENGDTLGYLIDENISAFGSVSVVLDLFNGTVITRTGIIPREKVVKKPVKKITIAEVKKELMENVFIGTDTREKQREQGILKVRTNGTYYLQSKRTGRFLKLSESLRKELKKRNQ